MRKINAKLISLALIVFFAVNFSLFAATNLNLNKSGNKKFNLNNNVSKNQVKFNSKAPGEEIDGTANIINGSFNLDPANIEATNGEITVEVKSMTTNNSRRDEHMMKPEWLDEAKFSQIKYKVKKLTDIHVESTDPKTGKAVVKAIALGEFILHGVTKELKSNISLTYILESAETKKRAEGDFVMIQADFPVKLSDFKITGKANIIGDKVAEIVNLKANIFAAGK